MKRTPFLPLSIIFFLYMCSFFIIGSPLMLSAKGTNTYRFLNHPNSEFAPLPLQLFSPDGRITLNFDLIVDSNLNLDGERMCYNVSYYGVTIIKNSALGLSFRGANSLERNFRIIDINQDTHFETYTSNLGKASTIINHYNQAEIVLQEEAIPNRTLTLIFRVFNDGVAFRYVIPSQPGISSVEIIKENSEFRFLNDHRAYILPLNSYATSYEEIYNRKNLSQIFPGSLIGVPLLVEIPNGPYVAITEADLTNYAGMYLTGMSADPNGLISDLSPLPNAEPVCVRTALPLITPWRVIMIGSTPGKLIESNLVLNLNDPCVLQDVSWIEPGKAAWSWWSSDEVEGENFLGGMNTQTMKHYTDFAAEMGLEYLVIDAGWYGDRHNPFEPITTTISAIDMDEIIRYAHSFGVKVMVWLNWEALDNQMDALATFENWGIDGIKVDFMNRDDQEIVQFYHRVLAEAAAHHLVVNFHGAYKPTGIRRTYPHLITREGVFALEYNKWSTKCDPEHQVTIPFIRMLAGPMDFTPGAFRTATKDDFVPISGNPPFAQGTRCQQLAMYVVYESQLQCLPDYPAAYRGETGLDFLSVVPTTWDETRVLNAKIGDYITIARRHGEEWYIGSMTDWTGRTLEINLNFLGNRQYIAHIYSDGPEADQIPTQIVTSEMTVDASQTIVANLAPGGGQVIRLSPSPLSLAFLMISGQVNYYDNGAPVENVSLNLSEDVSATTLSDADGYYHLLNLPATKNYTLKPYKEVDTDIGAFTITSYDAALTAQAAVGIRTLSDYQTIAADVDRDGQLLTYDAALIAQHAVRLPRLPSSHVAEWVFSPDSIAYHPLSSEQTGQNFTAVILGNVHGNWASLPLLIKHHLQTSRYPYWDDIRINDGKLTIPIIIEPQDELLSADIELVFDPEVLAFENVVKTELSENFQLLYNVENGRLNVGMYTVKSLNAAGLLLELNFRLIDDDQKSTQVELTRLLLNNNILFQSATQVDLNTLPAVPTRFALKQNYPNPFNSETLIQYTVPQTSHVVIEVFNQLGQKVKTLVNETRTADSHSIKWDGTDEKEMPVVSGVYIYKMRAGTFNETKRMALVR